jgi:hypothetical protein
MSSLRTSRSWTWAVLAALLVSVLGHLGAVEHRSGPAGVEHVDACDLEAAGVGTVSRSCGHAHEHELCPLFALRGRDAAAPDLVASIVRSGPWASAALPSDAPPGRRALSVAPKQSPPAWA